MFCLLLLFPYYAAAFFPGKCAKNILLHPMQQASAFGGFLHHNASVQLVKLCAPQCV